MQLYYNPNTKVIFATDDEQSDDMQKIEASQIQDLKNQGASVDASAQDQDTSGNVAPAAPAPDASVTTSGTDVNTAAQDAQVTANNTGNSGVVAVPEGADAAKADDPAVTGVGGVQVIPVESQKTTADVADPDSTIAAGPGESIKPEESNTNPESPAAAVVAPTKEEEAQQAAEGVDTTKNPQSVIVHGPVGSVTGTAVTPDGTPVVEAQPTAVTVLGPQVSANTAAASGYVADDVPDSVAQSNPYHGMSHQDALERMLDVMEGIAAMGKAEIQAEMMMMRAAFRRF